MPQIQPVRITRSHQPGRADNQSALPQAVILCETFSTRLQPENSAEGSSQCSKPAALPFGTADRLPRSEPVLTHHAPSGMVRHAPPRRILELWRAAALHQSDWGYFLCVAVTTGTAAAAAAPRRTMGPLPAPSSPACPCPAWPACPAPPAAARCISPSPPSSGLPARRRTRMRAAAAADPLPPITGRLLTPQIAPCVQNAGLFLPVFVNLHSSEG